MQNTNNIFISPHQDDACFSLAAIISLFNGGHLINVFTKSKWVENPFLATQKPPLSANTVTAIRCREDAFFGEAMNLERYDLELSDTSLRSLSWNLSSDQKSEKEMLEQSTLVVDNISPLLKNLISRNSAQSATLYWPMGIGGHRDHMAVLMAGKIIRSTTWGGKLRWLFYEELPYASHPRQREEGIKRFQSIFESKSIRKLHLALSPEKLAAKMKLVNVYASQHMFPPLWPEFVSHDSWRLGPHEALWEAT